MTAPVLCRDCGTCAPAPATARCRVCGSTRRLEHPERDRLCMAHVDCDAFYAAVEKRDDPGLRDRPVIVGGGARGVVTTACYLARRYGVRSAMPMFEARRRCPEAVVIRPRLARYAEVSRAIRARFEALTPRVRPLSLDEAFLDLSGTERLHGAPPAVVLLRLQARIRAEIGITVSIGLSHNMFLAKLASDMDKPNGFTLIGRAETLQVLAPLPVGALWGVGPKTAARLQAAGLITIADLRAAGPAALRRVAGDQAARLWQLAHGQDARAVEPDKAARSLSAETTFGADLARPDDLLPILWQLCERVSTRAKAAGLAGRVAILKLKRADHRLLSRRTTLRAPTQLADPLYRQAEAMLRHNMAAAPFRLLGVGLCDLVTAEAAADPQADLLDPEAARRAAAERAMDAIRHRFGAAAIQLGRSLRR